MVTFYQKLARKYQNVIKNFKLKILLLGTFQEELQDIYLTFSFKKHLKDMEAQHQVDILSDIPDEIPPSPLKTRSVAIMYDYVFVILNKGSTLAEAIIILPHYMDKLVFFVLENDKTLTDFDMRDFIECGIPIHYYKNKEDLLKKVEDIVYKCQYRKCISSSMTQDFNNIKDNKDIGEANV